MKIFYSFNNKLRLDHTFLLLRFVFVLDLIVQSKILILKLNKKISINQILKKNNLECNSQVVLSMNPNYYEALVGTPVTFKCIGIGNIGYS
jgi:hypothetical protein